MPGCCRRNGVSLRANRELAASEPCRCARLLDLPCEAVRLRGDEDAAARRRDFAAGIPSLSISDTAIELGESLLSRGAVPPGSESDALHIGIAAAQGADFLLTWNFRHINNAEMKAIIASVIESRGLVCPQICSPEELGGAENE